MTSVTLEVESPSILSADKIFKVFSVLDTVLPKVIPQVFKSIETVEGNGGVGTIKIYTFGDAVPFTNGKCKIDAVDTSNYTCTYTFIEGDYLLGILDSINHHIKIVPSPDGGSVFKRTVVYNCKGDEKPSEEILKKDKELHENNFKIMEDHVILHPEAY